MTALSDKTVLQLVKTVCEDLKLNIKPAELEEVDAKLIYTCFSRLCDLKKDSEKQSGKSLVEHVLDNFSSFLDLSLCHITPDALLNHDKLAIKNLFELFHETILLQKKEQGKEDECNDSETLVLLNHLLSTLKMKKIVKSIRQINSSLFYTIFHSVCPTYFDQVPTGAPIEDNDDDDEEEEKELIAYRQLLKTLSYAIDTPLDHIKPDMLVSHDCHSITKLIEVIVGMMEGIFLANNDKLSKIDQELVDTTNYLLKTCGLTYRVKKVSHISDRIFVAIFEIFTKQVLQDVNRNADTTEEKSRNVQIVIDVLSNDVVCTSLSHITGCDVIDGNRMSIRNLLEIFYELITCFNDKIVEENIERMANGEKCDGADDDKSVIHEYIDKLGVFNGDGDYDGKQNDGGAYLRAAETYEDECEDDGDDDGCSFGEKIETRDEDDFDRRGNGPIKENSSKSMIVNKQSKKFPMATMLKNYFGCNQAKSEKKSTVAKDLLNLKASLKASTPCRYSNVPTGKLSPNSKRFKNISVGREKSSKKFIQSQKSEKMKHDTLDDRSRKVGHPASSPQRHDSLKVEMLSGHKKRGPNNLVMVDDKKDDDDEDDENDDGDDDIVANCEKKLAAIQALCDDGGGSNDDVCRICKRHFKVGF
ncbi:hypothetical protein HELRODRAFT_176792 [Helobdella robusta]|uniref:DUF5745 domain-containing protein n=1 Tax=Helobdella robusta TaxID=6412 RepID=T1FAX1_HELRO|nr:hypothetical protein HELRODRAFT_176792 [Helobdella robusta]ESN99623.1 hypothetical protein HELRODRAFT_176792 [Helobdella robusta]